MFERLRSEYLYLTGALRVLKRVKAVAKNPTRTFPIVVEQLAARYGDRPALVSAGESLTYRDYDERANRYARWAQAQGVVKGDAVALLMENRPEYLVIWLGVARAGGVSALLNTNLTGQALAHSINIAAPRHIVVGADLLGALETARPHLDVQPQIWVHGANDSSYERMDHVVETFSQTPLSDSERVALTNDDKCLYIYTSGTTGLPKAANIVHYRVQSIMNGFSGAMKATRHDRMYVCLPLYHSSGGVLAVGSVLTVGGTAVIRDKFSAREFWDDIVKFDCTLFQYIGELCRYLVNSPPNPNEKKHKIRLCCGNGLRPDIWINFRDRFGLANILEFYGATEGNVVLLNFDSHPGSVGRIPKWAEKRFVTEVVRFDLDREVPLRNESGLCMRCSPNEVGEVIGKVLNDPERPSQRFEGYADKSATEKKILRDVFEQGDVWFRTGDLMRKDERGYFFFVDRIGDTFRWKGENVATSQVSEAITVFPGVRDANVYGVHIPGKEGRAGMAALVVDKDIDLVALHRHIAQQLPDYARPMFLRLQHEIEVTGTFKQRKVDLVKEGFDPAGTADNLYFADPETKSFRLLDKKLYDDICNGSIRL